MEVGPGTSEQVMTHTRRIINPPGKIKRAVKKLPPRKEKNAIILTFVISYQENTNM